ncbi:unnamed protein product [Paramecium sonneborni]|uniref:Uncharacterized protein n=1 Tax=Paramecium sonneborni TaxID=65129 RepID=A0A8S1QWW3_9CILI|nr:unnamed protein product [Paramecium sonneborni]
MLIIHYKCFSPDKTLLASGNADKSIHLWDVKTGQQKAKLDGHSDYVRSVCFSPDGTTLASGSVDKSIRLWDVKTEQQIQLTEKKYQDFLAQFKFPYPFPKVTSLINILFISQQAIFQAKGALILQGQFEDQSGINLKLLFKQKGSYILENNFKQEVEDTEEDEEDGKDWF